jgi:hypothetical protein
VNFSGYDIEYLGRLLLLVTGGSEPIPLAGSGINTLISKGVLTPLAIVNASFTIVSSVYSRAFI